MPDRRYPPGDFYIETFRPAHTPIDTKSAEGRVRWRAHRKRGFSSDQLHPSLTALFLVQNCLSQSEAIARVVEYASGKPDPQIQMIVGTSNMASLPQEG